MVFGSARPPIMARTLTPPRAGALVACRSMLQRWRTHATQEAPQWFPLSESNALPWIPQINRWFPVPKYREWVDMYRNWAWREPIGRAAEGVPAQPIRAPPVHRLEYQKGVWGAPPPGGGLEGGTQNARETQRFWEGGCGKLLSHPFHTVVAVVASTRGGSRGGARNRRSLNNK